MHRGSCRLRQFSATASPFFQIDSFTATAFAGNPAAVLLLQRDVPEDTMKRIAAENNLSETAFVRTVEGDVGASFQRSSRFKLRWFTPTVEVKLCGHGTLAAAKALFAPSIGNPSPSLTFETLSGDLHAQRLPDERIGLDFPINLASSIDDFLEEKLELEALVEAVLEGSAQQIADVAYAPTQKKLIVRLEACGEEPLRRLRPRIERLPHLHDGSLVTGISVTTAGSEDGPYDFFSRYFAPWNGIPEDPVNGSSHTILAPYWSKLVGGKTRLLARQSSARGGELALELQGSRVSIAGYATIVIQGEMETQHTLE